MPSAENHLEDETQTSTTITFAGVSVDFSVLPATQESGSSTIIRTDLKLPPGTSAHPSSLKFYKRLAEAGATHAAKQADYGSKGDPFANVRSSEEFGVPAWVGAMVRGNDKVSRIKSFIRNGNLKNESVEDSLRDLAVYAIIALVLYEESHARP